MTSATHPTEGPATTPAARSLSPRRRAGRPPEYCGAAATPRSQLAGRAAWPPPRPDYHGGRHRPAGDPPG